MGKISSCPGILTHLLFCKHYFEFILCPPYSKSCMIRAGTPYNIYSMCIYSNHPVDPARFMQEMQPGKITMIESSYKGLIHLVNCQFALYSLYVYYTVLLALAGLKSAWYKKWARVYESVTQLHKNWTPAVLFWSISKSITLE